MNHDTAQSKILPHQPDEYEERAHVVTAMLQENLQVKTRCSAYMVRCALLLLAAVAAFWFVMWMAEEQPGWWPFVEREAAEHIGVPGRR